MLKWDYVKMTLWDSNFNVMMNPIQRAWFTALHLQGVQT